MDRLTHIDERGNAVMVDVTEKDVTYRTARASGLIYMSSEALRAVEEGEVKKGDVLATARIAGIMAAKKTSDLIPLCHPLQLTKAGISFEISHEKGCILCECLIKLHGRTGAEMEALTGVSTALLTVYDMCKAMDKTMIISDIRLEEKSGGKSGRYDRTDVQTDNKTHTEKQKKEINIGW